MYWIEVLEGRGPTYNHACLFRRGLHSAEWMPTQDAAVRCPLRASSHSAAACGATLAQPFARGQDMHRAARVLSLIVGRDVDIEELKVVMIFCGAGLLVSLLAVMSLHIGFQADFF